jgi:hypothetical protein
MLESLSLQQVERALAWLADPKWEDLPHPLERLSQAEWLMLEKFLQNLLEERNSNSLH